MEVAVPRKPAFPTYTVFGVLFVGLEASSFTALAQDSWTQIEDPSLEHAFTVDVPKDWTVRCGLFRLGYSDVRVMVDMKSPDGKVEVRLSDVGIPAYFVPNQFHPREGEIYDLGAQAQMIVARYRSGREYALLYAKTRFEIVCQSLAPLMRDAGSPLPDLVRQPAQARKVTAGQASYRCQSKDGPRTAFVYAKTSLFEGFWTLSALGSFVAPPDEAALANVVLQHTAQTFRLRPQWLEHQKQVEAEGLEYQRQRQARRRRDMSMETARFEVRMQATQNQVNAFEHRQAEQADQAASWGNLLTGITPTVDPLGNPRNVWTGPKNGYWTNGAGNVVNSDTPPPGGGWQPLKPIP
jgi:hypothetical protein